MRGHAEGGPFAGMTGSERICHPCVRGNDGDGRAMNLNRLGDMT
jgi:hypothetical protein